MPKPTFNKTLIRSILLGIGILFAGKLISNWLASVNEKADPKISFQSKVVPATIAQTNDIPIQVNVNGRLRSLNRMELFAEVSGTLKNNRFRAGQVFGKGQVIAQLDDTEYRAQLTAARSSFMALVSQSLADIVLDYPKDAPLWQQFMGKINPKKILPELPSSNNQQLKQFISGRNILSTYYTIQSQEVRLAKHRIVAPYSGVLSEASIDPGTLVRAGQKIGTFTQQGGFELEASVTRNDLQFLKKGGVVKLHSDELDKDFNGAISRINSTINPTTQLVSVFIKVTGKELKEGLYLKATINTGSSAKALEVERNTLIDGKAIYVINPDSTLKLMPVELVTFKNTKAIIENVPDGTLIPSVEISGAFEGLKVVPQVSK
jgi:multidrug efflux pump subunit AcrA (membrane-fusion protein)